MALPLAEQRALKRLEPTILNHKNAMEFISSIGHLRSKYSKDVSIEKFWDDYVQLSIEIDWVKEGVNNQKEMMRA